MEREEIVEKFAEFLREEYYNDLSSAVNEGKKSISIDFSLLDKFDTELADYLPENPEEVIPLAEEAIKQIDLQGEPKLKIRFFNLPENRQIRIRNIRAEHIGKLISVDGIVKRASEIRPEVSEAIFSCPECGKNITVIQTERFIRPPIECDCGNRKNFRLLDQKLYDARWVAIEEPSEITSGERPSEIMIFLKEDLTSPKIQNRTEPGNRIKVVGILKQLPRRIKGTRSRQMEIYIDANSVESIEVEWEELEITPEDEKKILELAADPEVYNKLVGSIAPALYGMEDIKEAIALQLFGGEVHIQKDKSRARGDIHILLVGDPSTAKSVLMKVVSTLIPRGRYVSGKGVTGAGLCTIYDTLVHLEDGSLIPIGKLVEDEIKNSSKKIKEGFVTIGSPKKVLSLDQNLKIKPLKITKYWKLKAPKKLIKIITQTGKEVIVTPENPVPIIKNGQIIWRPAFRLNPEEYIATPRVCRVNPKITSLMNLLDKDAWLLNKQGVDNELIKAIKSKTTIRDFSREVGIDEDNLYYYWKHRGAPTIGEIQTISNKLGIKTDQILPKELTLSKLHGHRINIPLFMNSNLAYLMGLIAGDGSISKTDFGGFNIKFFNIHDDLLKTFESICKRELNINPSYDEDSNGIPYFRFNSKIFGELLNRYGVVDGDKSHNLKVTEELSLLPKNILTSYLQGVFDTDGSVIERKTKGSNYVELSSASKEFIRALQILLLRYGIVSLTKEKKPRTSVIRNRIVKSGKRHALIISGLENLKLFRKNIGFRLRDKIEKLNRIIEKSSVEHSNIDIIPEIGDLLKEIRNRLGLSAKEFYGYKNYSYEKGIRKPTRKFLRELLNEFGNIKELVKFVNSDIFWDKIKKIEVLENNGHEYVYDITVENEHSFIANGLIIHNTATVVRDEEFLGGWVLEAGALVMCNRSLICLHPSTKIIFNDKIVSISDLFNDRNSEEVIVNGEKVKICKIEGYLPTFDTNRLKISLNKPTVVGKKSYRGKIIKLKLDSGFSIKLTPNHKLLDGNTFRWKKASDFSIGDFILAPLKLISKNEDIYILDIVPDDWKVCLDKREKEEIKKEVLKKYKSIAEFNRKFTLDKRILCGGKQLTVEQFKEVVKDLEVLETWREKPLKYGRIYGRRKLKIAKITPDLGYILGFLFGDGHFNRKEGHAGISLVQSEKHKKYIERFLSCWDNIFREKIHEYESKSKGEIRGREVKSVARVFYYGSNLLVKLFDNLIGKNLENILSLSNDVLSGFIAGCFDSDGCINIKESTKKGRRYKVSHVEFLLSDDDNVNKNFALALRRFDVYSKLILGKHKVDIIRITGREDVSNLQNSIKKYSEKIKIELPIKIHQVSSDSDKLPAFVISQICKDITEEINTSILNRNGISSLIYDYKNRNYQPSREQLNKTLEKIGSHLSQQMRKEMEKLLSRDFLLDKVIGIEEEYYDGFVYDIHMSGNNNFIADGVFVHNCIDEFEKIEKGDQIALHEAMEQNTISIAKANIVATLPAQTAILGGGNPKLGRFDPYLPIREQIDVPETLLARFDLKFALRDVPNPEIDAKIADHILKARHYGEEEVKPMIEADLLKKYVAYTRKNCHPKLSREAGETIKDFFVRLREKVTSEEAPVPITLRQYEALIRLAEASAKVQLKNEVTKEDAIRAINLMKASLRQFGFDPETGRIDIDRVEGHITSAERGKIRIMLDVIEELTKTIGKNIPKEDITKLAKARGLREFDIEKMINELKNVGTLFEPRPGILQKM